MNKPRYIPVMTTLPEDVREEVRLLAESENRTLSRQAATLIGEALEARAAKTARSAG